VIYLLSDYYHPRFEGGGPVKSIFLLQRFLLKKDMTSIVLTSCDNLINKKNPNPNNGVLYLNFFQRLRIILSAKTGDIIWFNSFFSTLTIASFVFILLRLVKAKIILSPRGELSRASLSFKSVRKFLWIRVFNLFGFCQSTTFHFTATHEEDECRYFIPSISHSFVISNLIDADLFNKKSASRQGGPLRVVNIGRISRKKNIDLCFKVLSKVSENLIFDLYGPNEDESYFLSLIDHSKKMPGNVNVSFKGVADPQKIGEILECYDVFFSPTLNENFGHSIYEAMQVGVIPLISDQTPWSILNKFGKFALSLENYTDFVDRLNELAKLPERDLSELKDSIASEAYSIFTQQHYSNYLALLKVS
jgi:glycosyltransferase involved in cell wall biosynthesis